MWLTGAISIFVPNALAIFLTVTALYLVMNAGLLALFLRKGGPVLMLAGFALHWCYHLYSSVVFGLVLVMLVFTRTSAETKAEVSQTYPRNK